VIDAETPLVPALVWSSFALTAIVALRYVLSSGLFAWATRRLRPGLYDGQNAQIRREIGWSLLSAAIYGVPAGIVMYGWLHHDLTLIYRDSGAYPLWYWPVSLFIYLLLHDGWFYWTHRVMHRPKLFRIAHAVHHASKPPTAWTAMSFHPVEATLGAVFVPCLVFVIPIHVGALSTFVAIATLMGVINHMGWEIFPRWVIHSPLGNWVITASHHEKHHEEYRCNFGLYFRFWDRLCKSDRGLSTRLAKRASAARDATW
jgi:sterol desaturase/sphingolipid hydroxylase (fatty acid hydroxylase superfamily)